MFADTRGQQGIRFLRQRLPAIATSLIPQAAPLFEDYGSVAIAENPLLQMPANSPGKNNPFHVPSLLDPHLGVIRVRYPDHILLDDGAFIEIVVVEAACLTCLGVGFDDG